jgi:hypothetical protein
VESVEKSLSSRAEIQPRFLDRLADNLETMPKYRLIKKTGNFGVEE